jgi:CheY-like chemotaxis protein
MSLTRAAPRMSKTILVVEDSAAVRKVICQFLETRGDYVCAEACDGQDGIQKAMELRPDLILLDVSMPRLNGVEAASILKNTLPHVPIVFVTMYEEYLGHTLSSVVGVRAVVSKRDGILKMLDCVKNLLEPASPVA